MLRRRLLLLPLADALAWAPPALAAPALLPEAAAISPAGQAVAYVTDRGPRPAVIVKDFATGRSLLRAELGAIPVRRIQWAGEGRLLILGDAPGGGAAAYLLDVASRRLTRLSPASGRGPQTIVGLPAVRTLEGRPVVFLQAADKARGLALVRVDLDPLALRTVAAGEPRIQDWVVGDQGQPAASALYDPAQRLWTLRVRAAAGWREAHAAIGPRGAFRLLGLARDGRAVLFAAREPDRRWTWREARLDGAPAAQPLVVDAAAEPLQDPQDGRVIGVRTAAGYVFFDPADAAAWKSVAAAFPRDRASLASWSADRRRVLALVDSPAEPAAYAQVDLAARVAYWIGPASAVRAGQASHEEPHAPAN